MPSGASPRDPNLKLCFILGIMQRSGSNYLYRTLRLHPRCIGPGPIWEDSLLRHSHHLAAYADTLLSAYNPKWRVEETVATRLDLKSYFGDALARFLKRQVSAETLAQTGPHQPLVLLTKTPGVRGLENFFELFPDEYLLIIVRDGRALVESGVRSFDWDYESATRAWNKAAGVILDFAGRYQDSGKKFLIVKYEDLFTSPERTLPAIFEFLDLDPGLFDFAALQTLEITGSSDLRQQQSDQVHWTPQQKPKDFNPLARFSHWTPEQHERFNWIAGSAMTRLGYSLEPGPAPSRLRNRLLDWNWERRRISRNARRRLANLLRRLG